ncbi:MAG: glycosyltransferase family 2 protein, partial [Chthoniobacterales bacterium]
MSSFFRRKKWPRFSVIIATYGRSRFIIPTIESALYQRHSPFEVIVVGDGCDDDTEEVIRRKFGRRVRWLNLPEHTGAQSFPNNAGIKAARGSHIAYLGHDDIWSRQHLEMLAKIFRQNEADFAVSGCVYYGPPGAMFYLFTGLFGDADTDAGAREFFPPSSLAHAREIVDRIGEWENPRETKPPVDCEFLIRAAACGCRFKSTRTITVHKFAAGHRYLSYRFPSCAEQEKMLARLRTAAGEARAFTQMANDLAHGASVSFSDYFDFDPFAPGELYERSLTAKGLQKSELRSLETEQIFVVDDSPAALDWRPLEQHEQHGPLRWSGPSPNPRYFLNVSGANSVALQIHIIDFADETAAETLRL